MVSLGTKGWWNIAKASINCSIRDNTEDGFQFIYRPIFLLEVFK